MDDEWNIQDCFLGASINYVKSKTTEFSKNLLTIIASNRQSPQREKKTNFNRKVVNFLKTQKAENEKIEK